MASQEHLAILKQGVETWNQWRQEHPEIRPDLRKADLSDADLRKADLSEANLSEAKLNRANLSEADLFEADLSEADLSEADLFDANLFGVRLNKANLNKANLSEVGLFDANLNEANLSGAELVKARLDGAHLLMTDLSGTNLFEANLHKPDLRGANLSESSLRGADLSKADLSRADLRGADLRGATLIATDLTGATLTQCIIYGTSVWNVQLDGARQDNLIITLDDEPTITVDDLEVAQFIYLLLNHKKLRNVLNAVTQRGVLLLGRFGGGGIEVLQAIAAKLREEQYLPIIFDFDRPSDRNFVETVTTLVGLSRFIIADLSGPSVPLELYATVPHFKIPFVPILEAGRKSFSMAPDLLEYPWVIRPPVIFANIDELISLMPSRIIAPAEERHRARQQLLDELFCTK